jgi:hypothetical protein
MGKNKLARMKTGGGEICQINEKVSEGATTILSPKRKTYPKHRQDTVEDPISNRVNNLRTPPFLNLLEGAFYQDEKVLCHTGDKLNLIVLEHTVYTIAKEG